jgi:hypothetical protein
MYDPCSYVIVPASLSDAQAALVRALQSRGWTVVVPSTVGARHVTVWRAREGGFAVMDLDSSWTEADSELARTVSEILGVDSAAYYYSSRGDVEHFDLFRAGAPVAGYLLADSYGEWDVTKAGSRIFFHDFSKDTKGGTNNADTVQEDFDRAFDAAFDSGPLVPLARLRAGTSLNDFLERDSSAPVELSFTDGEPLPHLKALEAAVHRLFVPVIAELSFRPTRAEFRDLVAFEAPAGNRRLRVQVQWGGACYTDVLWWHESTRQWLSDEDHSPPDDPTRPPAPRDVESDVARAAGEFARRWQDLAKRVPELADSIAQAAQTPVWRAAIDAADALARAAEAARERKTGWRKAEVVFRGAQLMLVATEDQERFTFKFDTSLASVDGKVAVNRIIEGKPGVWVGSPRARMLRVGGRVFHFEESGAFARASDDDGSE